jgi:putative membrane protein
MLSTALAAGSTVLADNHWDGPGPWWPLFPLFWLLILGAVIFFVTRRARHCGYGSRSGVSRLSERYAAGEIDEAEYRERLAVLKEDRR